MVDIRLCMDREKLQRARVRHPVIGLEARDFGLSDFGNLGFIGVKMLLPVLTRILATGFQGLGYGRVAGAISHFAEIPIIIALGLVGFVLVASVAASLIWPVKTSDEEQE